MKDEQLASGEVVLREYPHSTRWMEGQQVKGVGNLVLTTKRLAFLHQVPINEEEITRLRKLSEKVTTTGMIDIALSLHGKNFQVPLSSVTAVKTGLHSMFPFPRVCLRVYCRSKRKDVRLLNFMFTIPLWKGWFQLELTTVKAWARAIERAARNKQLAAG